ncbi:MlaD family protein [Nocardia implantans]|uniref:MlaD family protein n=1 Tax=Nocardia implantans TaxID=3108168 RepID=A0ABU6AV86_9NOCA|nr:MULTISPECIES: MlaD family protein [unclassified Nocardia]MBF6192398.1 MCE family protein [Nocardia beijingensis]MEA3527699.1 MlaD family protein [Nocardia sp. CDC192]MEB3511407.1 MlaD family protein [Nocardia sp. CDC186]
MSYRRSLIGVSLFVTVAVALLWVTFVTLHRGIDGGTHPYSAVFSDVSGLRAGDDVRMAGVRVGRVDKIELDGTRARVRFRVEAAQRLTGDTKASITYQNVIGQRYLGLFPADFGDPAPLRPGGEIPLARTEPSFDISALLNGFEPLFGGLDPKQVDNVTGALIKALQGDNTSVVLLIEQVSSLARSLAGPDQVLGAVITGLNQVVGDLAVHSGEVGSLITRARAIIDGLTLHRDELLGTLSTAATVTDRMAGVVEGVQPQLDEMLSREPGFTRHFQENKANFAYLGFNLPALMKGLARVSQEGAYLNTYLCNFGVDLFPSLTTLVPTIVGLASATGKPQQSPICG